ncbi:transcriptional regulator, LysR family [[Leptolyngbya] sp. PCC 7376]|uniref:LysR family transcriptional regulator n=1 Tax=[Leptolyngbya] sp. PCC 7376 TaxID=111781 RepID=UPI00029F1226|nr:LysR family transcriptional regulator [[Leptolyngbya] sp. PCC 7376]AFY38257.1 transcriptional regulator, LysR family [[Leptolyngbya] sp. PCC 7376]
MIPATLHQLKVFETAARHGSFTKAAAELSITQPTVSGQIKQLTQTIGMPLFEHIGRKLYLTEAGTELLSTCQNVFEQLDNFEMKLAALQGAKRGQLRLGVITTTKYFVPRILGEFCQSYPNIDVSLQVINHQKLHDRMADNKDDLYILSNLPGDLEVHSEAFLDNPLVVVARADHPLANKKNIPIAALEGVDFISREMGSGTRRAVEKLFGENDVSVQVRLELGSNEAIKQAIAGGLGISVLSRHTLITEPPNGELTVLDVKHFPIKREWYVAHLAGKQLSVIAAAFLEFMLKSSQTTIENSSRRSLALQA